MDKVFVIFFVFAISATSAWQRNEKPMMNSTLADYPNGRIHRIKLWPGARDGHRPMQFRLLLAEKEYFIIGGLDVAIQVAFRDLSIRRRLNWHSNVERRHEQTQVCLKKADPKHDSNPAQSDNRLQLLCHNYIRTFLRNDSTDFLVCGTFYGSPVCRRYTENEQGYEMREGTEHEGHGKCPQFPDEKHTVQLHGRAVFSAVGVGNAFVLARFNQKPDGGIDRQGLVRTGGAEHRVLRNPEVVSSFIYGEKMYYVIREVSHEHQHSHGPRTVSRIARVCLNDRGGNERFLTSQWTTLFKTTLRCSMPGRRHHFNFHEVQAISDVRTSKVHAGGDDVFYALFRTAENSISASAVCAYNMSDIVEAFSGDFRDAKVVWGHTVAWSGGTGREDHPSTCRNESNAFSDKALGFIQSHSVMSKNVRPLQRHHRRPLFVRVAPSAPLTAIAVQWDREIQTTDTTETVNIIYLGTRHGHVLKFVEHEDIKRSTVVDDTAVHENGQAVTDLKIHKEHARLVVFSHENLLSIPLDRCESYKSCGACFAAQDPTCNWCGSACRNDCRGSQFVKKHLDCPPPLASDILGYTLVDNTDGLQEPQTGKVSARVSSSQGSKLSINSGVLAFLILVCIAVSLVIGFTAGYIANMYFIRRKRAEEREIEAEYGLEPKDDRNCDLQLPVNIHSYQPKKQHMNESTSYASLKSLNIVQNKLNNTAYNNLLAAKSGDAVMQNNGKPKTYI